MWRPLPSTDRTDYRQLNAIMASSSAVQLTVTETGTEIPQPNNGGKRLLGIHSVLGSSTAACRGYCMAIKLHWLDVTDRIRLKLAVLMYRCLHGTAPLYLVNSCTPTAAGVSGHQCLHSAVRQSAEVDWRYCLNSVGRRCFAVAGPSTWNSLPESLRDPALSLNMFRRQLKTYFLCEILTRCTPHIYTLLLVLRYYCRLPIGPSILILYCCRWISYTSLSAISRSRLNAA